MIIVWREKEGPILSTFAAQKSRLPLSHPETPEATKLVTVDELVDLVKSRKPFDKVFVTDETAEAVLGWTVEVEDPQE